MLKAIERLTGQRITVEKLPTVTDLRARRLELTRSALSMMYQTAGNAVGMLSGTRERHGSPFHLFEVHYAALAARREIPAPLSRSMEAVRIARTIWPL